MHLYVYDGIVKEFGRTIADKWHGETVAESERKARSNLTYQYKKSHNKSNNTKITLTSEIIQIN